MTRANLKTLGRYQIITELGQGGMARVYLAVARGPGGFNKLLVIKQIRGELVGDEEFMIMFMDEARLAARLNHPNVVQTYEVGEQGARRYLTMEYLDGQPLHELFKRIGREQMPLAEHLWILKLVLAGLHYAHELADFDGTPLNVVHRDVSPQNVFLTYDGQVKLVDFGIAKAAGAANVTKKGVFKGKLSYTAPEQLTCDAVDRRADIFSAGVMLWEALAGRRMPRSDDVAGNIFARAHGEEPTISEVNAEVAPELAAICDKAMALSPDERFDNALEMQQALELYLESVHRTIHPRQVAALLTTNFGTERSETQSLIDTVIKTVDIPVPSELQDAAESDARPPDTAPTAVVATGSTVGGVELSSMAPESLMPDSSAEPTAVMAPRSRRNHLIVAGALLAVAAVVLMLVFSRSTTTEPTAAAAATGAGQLASATPTVSSRATEQTTVKVSITVLPSNATVTLDGKKLSSNPFKTELPREKMAHILRATAKGYKTEERLLQTDKDIVVAIELEPAKPTSGRPPGVAGATSGGSGLQRVRPRKPDHTIDPKNPYE